MAVTQRWGLWERWAPLTGALSAVLLVIAVVMSKWPGGGDSDQKIITDYGHASTRTNAFIASYLFAFAALFLLWFVGTLRTRLLAAEGEPAHMTPIAFGSGVALAAVMFVVAGANASIPGRIAFDKATGVPADVATLGWLTGIVFLVGGAFAGVGLIGATSLLGLRTRALPAWLVWLGVVCVVALILGFFFITMIALPIWLVVMSFVLLRARAASAPPPL
jgi:hypothetical protein